MIHNDKFLRMQGQRISNHSHFKKGVVILGGVPDIKISKKTYSTEEIRKKDGDRYSGSHCPQFFQKPPYKTKIPIKYVQGTKTSL